ncbi:MAG: YdcF family protein [Minisyncoccia bacterium]
MNQTEIENLAKIIWDYHHLNQKLEKADCILVLGSHDLRIAEHGAKLFLEGWAPLIIFSGGLGHLTKEIWSESEADQFARIAINMGVPKEKIIVENKSTNTGENIKFSRELLKEKNIDPKKFIVVQKPYMERRTYATFKKVWPEKEFVVTSPPISFENYPDKLRTKKDVIEIMVGDLQRIKLYAENGFQIPQKIPVNVWDSFKKLVRAGYTKHLVKED